jgi:hypothetical protein
MTLHRLIEQEMADYRAARTANDAPAAWRALERVHIISQTLFWPHIQSHIAMLGYALALRDGKEIAGQLMRLLLAPLGNLTGRLPIGNTGRADVSAFMPMTIDDELKRQIQDARSAN